RTAWDPLLRAQDGLQLEGRHRPAQVGDARDSSLVHSRQSAAHTVPDVHAEPSSLLRYVCMESHVSANDAISGMLGIKQLVSKSIAVVPVDNPSLHHSRSQPRVSEERSPPSPRSQTIPKGNTC